MPIPLWTLLWLNTRAAFRRVGRQARTPKGAVLVTVGVVMLAAWLGWTGFWNARMAPASPMAIRTVGPLTILLMCVLNVCSSAGERAVTFTPAEVDFLFPGPFTRRQLLAYKLVKTALKTVASAVLIGVAMGRYGGTFAGRFVGGWLTIQFVTLVAMVAALAQANVGERAFSAGRRWVLVALGVALAVAVGPTAYAHRSANPAALAAAANGSRVGRVVLMPFGVFAQAVTARHLAEGLKWDAIAVAIVGALVAAVVSLDANYLETAAAVSGKRYARLARVRTGGLAGMSSAASARVRLPMVPWLGGAGPIAWRQLTGVLRTGRGLLLMLGLITVVVAGAVSRAEESAASIATVIGVSVWTNLFLTSMLKFDFRGDLDHIDGLRSLPVRPWAVAAAELVAPTVVLTVVQGMLVAAVAIFGRLPVAWLVGAAAFVVPVNALLVGSENLIFLLFPYRPASAVAGDMGMVGRQTVVFFCRLLVLAFVTVVAGAVGAVGYVLARQSVVAGGAAAWLTMAAAVAGVVVLIGWAFSRFDPSTDVPA